MKAVVFYESADDLAEKALLHAGPAPGPLARVRRWMSPAMHIERVRK